MRRCAFVLPVMVMVLWFAGCGPSAPAPDMSPVGGGLAAIGLGIVVAAFIISLTWGRGPGKEGDDEQ